MSLQSVHLGAVFKSSFPCEKFVYMSARVGIMNGQTTGLPHCCCVCWIEVLLVVMVPWDHS